MKAFGKLDVSVMIYEFPPMLYVDDIIDRYIHNMPLFFILLLSHFQYIFYFPIYIYIYLYY